MIKHACIYAYNILSAVRNKDYASKKCKYVTDKKEIKIKHREDEQGGASASLGKQPLRSLKNRLADKNGLYIMFSDSKLEYLFSIQISLDFQLSDMF